MNTWFPAKITLPCTVVLFCIVSHYMYLWTMGEAVTACFKQDLTTSVQRELLGSHGGRAVVQWPQPQRCKCPYQVWGEGVGAGFLHCREAKVSDTKGTFGLLSYILFVFVWHKEKHHSGQSPQVKLLIMSNIRYDHVVELIHCSHQIQCKAGTGGLGGWGRCNAGCSNLASFSLQKAARDLWILDLFFVLWCSDGHNIFWKC